MRSSPRKLFALLGACALLLAGAGGLERAAAADSQNNSVLRIGANEGLPATRSIKLGLNKSLFIELPREVRDVMVSNPKKLEAVMQTSTRAYLIGSEPGEANLIFNDKDGHRILTLEVSIERDLSALTDLLTRLIPGSKIRIDAIGERAVLTGTVRKPIDASRACEIVTSFLGPLDQQNTTSSATGGSATTINTAGNTNNGGSGLDNACKTTNVINMITVEGDEQVLLKVSVVEMERDIVKQLGIDLNTLINSGNFAFAALSDLPFPVSSSGKGFLFPFLNSNGTGFGPPPTSFDPLVAQTAGGGLQWQSGASRVQSVIRALEQDGLVHTLAEPNLTAISGETANFLAGGEFPVPVPQGGSGNVPTVTIQFKPFGVGLAFTPVVMSEGRISLKVSTEVSEITNQGAVVLSGFAVPALKVRRAETTVELPSGGSMAMAGLLSDQSRQAISGYPGLKNLPVLGALFRSRDFQKNETELVVIVTPYVVKPVPRQDLAQPDQGFGWASDADSDVLGQLNRVYGRHPERAPVGKFDGDVGFIVEE